MTEVSDWQGILLEASTTVLQNIFNFLPTLFAALIVFLVGLFLAKWAKKLTVKLLRSVNLDLISKKLGLEEFLAKAEIKIKIEEILGNIIKWIIVFVFFITTINILGLESVSAILNSVLATIPKILSAALVFTAGVLLAGLVESLVKGAVGQLDTKTGRMSGKFASWLVVIFATLAAIGELGIAQSLINILFIGVVAMLSLGFGLALGLGAKDLVSQFLKEWYEKLRKEMKKK